MTRRPQVSVAGAGALGLSAALALADAGCAVTIWDPAQEGRASAVAAGMLAPVFEAVLDVETEGAFDLMMAARDLWPALERRAGVALDRSGALAVGEGAWLNGIRAALTRLGVHGADLPIATAKGLTPGLSVASDLAILVRDDWRLEPKAALAALRAACQAAGVAFRRAAVGGREEADWLVVATGADPGLALLAPELARLSPIKGQIARYPELKGPGVVVRGEGCYLAPSADGLAVGATMETGLSDTQSNSVALAPVITAAGRLFPHLSDAAMEVGAGVRAATPDALPMAGFSETPKVILATGARRNGWLLAPMVAEVVAACVTGRDAGRYAARLDPRRFD